MKKISWVTLISFLVIWMSVVIDLFFWKQLPDKIATHFNSQMIADGWSSKPVAILSSPVIFTLAQILIIYLINRDSEKFNTQKGTIYSALTIMPILSIFLNIITLSTSLGGKSVVASHAPLNWLSGIILIILGVMMKFVKQNGVVGIRLPWTMSSQKNWQLTHLLAARTFIFGGIVEIITGIFAYAFLWLPILLIVAIIPSLYSYILFRRGI